MKVHISSSFFGLGFLQILTVVFIILKILEKITWSWLWVLSPLWMPWIVILAFIFIVLIIVVLFKIFR